MTTKQALDLFCREINGNKPILIRLAPRTWAREAHCFQNVHEMIARYGGRDRPGWIFSHRPFGGEPGIFVAAHHCVWESREGELLDVTPAAQGVLGFGNANWFLPDDAAQPVKPFGIPRPSRFFTTSKNQGVLELLHRLRRVELADWVKLRALARSA
jgi:hypothetical protein